MIEYQDRESAVKQMNEYGRKHLPFLFLIDFELLRPVILPLNDINTSELLYDINGVSNANELNSLAPIESFEPVRTYPMPFADYKRGFDYIVAQEKAGNSYLVNLTYPTPIKTSLSLKDIFLNSQAKYRLWWDQHFVVFSPETFVTIDEKGQIASNPMKGTIDASWPNARKWLMNDPKEKAEHATIVDLIRNDLSMVARNVRVSRYRYLEELTTSQGGLLQTSSEISGQLPEDYLSRLGDIIFRLLPAGSISGAPKRKTVELIQHAENDIRGYYTGICGIFDGRQLDSGVMIRFIENSRNRLLFRSGGGITAQSNASSEYQEMIRKVYLPFVPKETLIYI